MRLGTRIRVAIDVRLEDFLSEIDHEVQQYQVYRAHRTTQAARGNEYQQAPGVGIVQNWMVQSKIKVIAGRASEGGRYNG